MRAAVVHSFQQPPQFAEFDTPAPSAGEQLVRVRCAGLHQLVRALAAGTHYGSAGLLPFVPGVDGVGTLADGTRVYFLAARAPFGSMAGQSLTTTEKCMPVPDGLSDAFAAAACNPGMSSWVALKARAKFQPGENVLVLGATGASGRMAVQIARRLGAKHVIAAGRDTQQLERLPALGADAVILLNQPREALVESFREASQKFGVNVVLDYLWGAPAEALLEAVSAKGLHHAAPRLRYVEIGQSAGRSIQLAGTTLRSTGLELLGSGFGSASTAEIMHSISEFLASAATQPFAFDFVEAPLSEVAARWPEPTAARLVFRV